MRLCQMKKLLLSRGYIITEVTENSQNGETISIYYYNKVISFHIHIITLITFILKANIFTSLPLMLFLLAFSNSPYPFYVCFLKSIFHIEIPHTTFEFLTWHLVSSIFV